MTTFLDKIGIPRASVPSLNEVIDELSREVYLSLGGGMIDIELDPDHVKLAIERAVDRYRTRSTNSVQESFMFMETQPEQNEYVLPSEVSDVIDVYRRGATGNTPGGTFFDPFEAGIVNSIYAVPFASGTAGDLVTYDFAMQYQELVGRLFGRELNFTWVKTERKLIFHRRFMHPEQLLLWVNMYKPLNVLWGEPEARQWIRDCTIAYAKLILGEARSYISNLPGPGTTITLNGEALKQEAKEELSRLEEEVKRLNEQNQGWWFIRG